MGAKDFSRIFAAVKPALSAHHLMPLYMNASLAKTISPGLKKHMQGKSCFNFRVRPDAEAIEELRRLTAAAADDWGRQKLL